MATFTQDNEPTGQVLGDLWVRDSGRTFRWNGAWWIRHPANDEIQGIMPPGGARDLHLAKRAVANYDTHWVQASEGLTHYRDFSGDTVQVLHNLRQLVVSVEVVDTAGNPHIPDIEYIDGFQCILHFVHPVTGTIAVRK